MYVCMYVRMYLCFTVMITNTILVRGIFVKWSFAETTYMNMLLENHLNERVNDMIHDSYRNELAI